MDVLCEYEYYVHTIVVHLQTALAPGTWHLAPGIGASVVVNSYIIITLYLSLQALLLLTRAHEALLIFRDLCSTILSSFSVLRSMTYYVDEVIIRIIAIGQASLCIPYLRNAAPTETGPWR